MVQYNLSYTLTYIKEYNRIYNWLNGEYVEFDDMSHPFLNLVKNKSSNFERFQYQDSDDDFEWLLEKKFIINNSKTIENIIKQEISERESLNELNLILLPVNNACNFNCVYCYEDHSNKKYMRDIEKDVLIKFISNSNINRLRIEFFGGEPLLNKSFIIKLCEEINKIQGIYFTASITTNAYLLDSNTFKQFIKLNINSYQITIDGLEEDHNKLRPLSNNSRSYTEIINNLIEISSIPQVYKFNIIIRVNFNQYSATHEKRKNVLNKFKSLFGEDNRFGYLFRPIGDYASVQMIEQLIKVYYAKIQVTIQFKKCMKMKLYL